MEGSTIAAVATPPGPGGIAVIRLSGPGAIPVAEKIFRPKNQNKSVQKAKGYTALFGGFWRGDSWLDDGIALFFRAPHSYTGEDVVELSCHGGDLVSQELLRACLEAGAEQAGPGEFSKRAYLNGKMDLLSAEAVMDLIAAGSRQGLASAGGALSGKWRENIEKYKQEIRSAAAQLSAWLDYPEEDVLEIDRREITQKMRDIRTEMDTLLENYANGQRMRRGIRVAIVGKPNVGKSTLFNLLTGRDRAIVTPLAGTTRDVLREEVQIAGYPLLLSDTAGLHESDNLIEREGIRRSGQEIDDAELILLVLDAGEKMGINPDKMWEKVRKKPSLCIVNKSDLNADLEIQGLEKVFGKVLVVSAQEEGKIAADKIEKAILETLELEQLNPDAMLLANERQRMATQRAREGLFQAEQELNEEIYDASSVSLQEALQAFCDLSGESASEAIIEEVFTQFCVGK